MCLYVTICMFLCLEAHVLEETHDAKDGVEFLSKTRSDWKDSSFGNHLNWHLTLHYFGEFSSYLRLILHTYNLLLLLLLCCCLQVFLLRIYFC